MLFKFLISVIDENRINIADVVDNRCKAVYCMQSDIVIEFEVASEYG